MKHSLPFAYFAVGVVFLPIPLGCERKMTAVATDAPATALAATAVDRVTASVPERKTLDLRTEQPARIEAYEETPMYPKIAGYVEEVAFDIGDSVKRGETLVKLWIPEAQDDVEQKNALVEQAEAEIGQALAAVDAALAAVESASARVNQASAGVTRASGEHARWQAEHTRMKQLASNGSVTQKLVDEALSQLSASEASKQEAEASVQSAHASLKEAQVNVKKAQADQRAAEARLRVANADLVRTNTMFAYANIKAPFDGMVTRRNVDTGHYVQPANGSAQPLLVIARNDAVRVFVDVPQGEAALIDCGENGDPAVVRVPGLDDQEFEAKVTRSSWSLDPANRSLRIEIDIPNEKGVLRPGMYATASIQLDRRSDVLTLPITAILRDGRDAFCCCVSSGKIERRKIELGLRSGGEVEVREGIRPNDTVVRVGVEALQPGQPVEVREPAT